MVSILDTLGLKRKKSTKSFIKKMLKMKQLKTVSAYLKSCTRPRNSLCANAMNLLSIKPSGKLTIKLKMEEATCGLSVYFENVMLSSENRK